MSKKKKNMDTIENKITGKKIQIALNDFPEKMNYNEATIACKNLGRGWRLPTKWELSELFENKDTIGGFTKTTYWSSTEDENDKVLIQFFSGWDNNAAGASFYTNKTKRNAVRAVKTI